MKTLWNCQLGWKLIF